MIQAMNFNTLKSIDSAVTPKSPVSPTPAESIKEFSSFLTDAINGVAAQEKNVGTMNEKFLLGEVSADQVMIASEQAMLSLQLTTQVRNKVIEAYQEIMRTQI
ncbi:flagellar hook-basal body complex protein FliE [Fontibacillus phaseoli]|uniref:Flagellar hook-basal body complex protein FliE n=1 Tax=Fontibacillus phaseoli TaxID=1416533 RepID=A0A369BIB8_9BACL|nr:flagellar hook-basal body complex protein FliE [Fontibacillus phaseoli]